MGRTQWIAVLFGIWVGLYAASVLVAAFTAPAGDGFVRGVNRLGVFLQFQGAASILALVLWRMARGLSRGWQRWLARVPLLLALGLLLLIAGVIVSAGFDHPRAEVPAALPVTVPVE